MPEEKEERRRERGKEGAGGKPNAIHAHMQHTVHMYQYLTHLHEEGEQLCQMLLL